jgi:hypothetical protein
MDCIPKSALGVDPDIVAGDLVRRCLNIGAVVCVDGITSGISKSGAVIPQASRARFVTDPENTREGIPQVLGRSLTLLELDLGQAEQGVGQFASDRSVACRQMVVLLLSDLRVLVRSWGLRFSCGFGAGG